MRAARAGPTCSSRSEEEPREGIMNDKQKAMGRFRSIRKQVSMFLLTALFGFAALVTLVAYKQGMFVQHTDIYFQAPDATGINKGMAVRLPGVPAGTGGGGARHEGGGGERR